MVGPKPAFMDYVSHVLPTLGEDSVDQRAVAELVDPASRCRAPTRPRSQRLKADPRLAEVVRRAAGLASAGGPEELDARLEGRSWVSGRRRWRSWSPRPATSSD